MKYSVIIPAYNAEKTIRRCVDSVLSQLPEDGEIIIIDDGSVDRTRQICEEYASRDRRIRSFSQQNGGVSSARYLGLSYARGYYIMFVDSDDAVRENYFALIDKYAANDPDFMLFHKDDSFLPGQSEFITSNSSETRKALRSALCRQLLNCPWERVFRRDLIEENGLRFDERLSIGEDKVFVVQYVLKSSSAVFAHADIYQVFTDNIASLSRKKREELDKSVLLEHKLLFDAAEEDGDPDMLKAVTFSFFRSAYTVAQELQKYSLTEKERVKIIRSMCQDYCSEKRIQIGSVNCWLIAAPVLLKMANMIELIVRINWNKKHR